MGGAWTGSGDNRPRSFASGSAEDVTVREYRRGDDLRRVHWRSSARVGELMVRREEQPWQSRATLFLDNRTRAHRGQGIASSLEAAVSAAASVAVHLSQRGFTVRLVTATGEDPGTVWHFRAAELNTGPLLEALAVVQPTAHTQFDMGWLGESANGGLVVAVLGALDNHDQPMLRRMLHHAGSALADRARRRAVAARGRPPRGHRQRRACWVARAGGPPTCGRATGSRRVWQELGRSSSQGARLADRAHVLRRHAEGPCDDRHPTVERRAAPSPASSPPTAQLGQRLAGRMGGGASAALALAAAAAGHHLAGDVLLERLHHAARALPRPPLPARRGRGRARDRAAPGPPARRW